MLVAHLLGLGVAEAEGIGAVNALGTSRRWTRRLHLYTRLVVLAIARPDLSMPAAGEARGLHGHHGGERGGGGDDGGEGDGAHRDSFWLKV